MSALSSRDSIATAERMIDIRLGQKKLFLSNKGERYYAARYEDKLSKFLKASEQELHHIHQAYPRDHVSRDVDAQDKMWRNVLRLQEVLWGEEEWSDFRRLKLLRDLHGNFSQITAKRFVSRPNFEACFLKASRGYAHRTARDEHLVLALDSVYSSFDVHSKEEFDWRRFLFYLHFVIDPTKPVKDQILHAFTLIGTKCIDLKDLGLVLFPLVKADATKDVLTAMDDSWARAKASQQRLDENLNSTTLTLKIFQQMLEQDGLKRLFAQSTSPWGRGGVFPVHICQWEDYFYNDTLLQLVKTRRRALTVADKLDRDDRRTKLNVWRYWLEYAKYQSSRRSMFNRINHRMKFKRKARGLDAFLQRVVNHNAALDIQRVGRGHLTRNIARWCWTIFSSATLIQTRFRMQLAKRRLHELSSRYNWAIVTVQRLIRGALGRRLAWRRLMTLVDQEHRKNAKERERLEMERGIWSLTKLQACWRRKVAAAKSLELRHQRQREILIRRAMETERNKFLRERQIYERQLENFYRSMKEDHDSNIMVQSKLTHDQVKVRTLRRRLKNEELMNAPPDMSEHEATEKWKMDWEAKIEAGVQDIKAKSVQCLDRPDNSLEKKTRATIRKRVKGRVPQVLARADERGIPMETKEARTIAREETIHIIGEEERTRLRSEMEHAFLERARLKEEARLLAESKAKEAHARATVYAVSLVATACRKWLARKELRRMCLKTYEKLLDESSHAFFYRNKVTGEVSWAKPKAMGAYEMPAKDEWKVLRDAHDFPYYFNPFLMEMQWTPPNAMDMCCGVVLHTWWREYPVRSGRCPNFGSKVNEDDGKRYCEECWAAQRV